MSGLQMPVPPSADEVFYPSSDGQPMAETETHVLVMVSLIATLRHYCRRWADVYVIGNIFLYYEENNANAVRSPDVMVVRGVDPAPRRLSFRTWEEGAVPCVVIELTSKGTASEDLGPKKDLYERLGVREYFLFDPLGEYLERPLMGYLNGPQGFEALTPAADGSLLSQELGLRLVPEGEDLALLDVRTQQRLAGALQLPDLFEQVRTELAELEQRAQRELKEERDRGLRLKEERDTAAHQLKEARDRADKAEQARQKAEQERDAVQNRITELLRELERLRDQ
jgi:Uma2 family endonuclease